MKKTFFGVFLALSISSSHAQIPVTDGMAIAKLVVQITETINILRQVTATTKSVETMLSSSQTMDQLNALNSLLTLSLQANALNLNAGQIIKKIDDFNSSSYNDSRQIERANARQAALAGAGMLDRMPSDAERVNKLVDQSQSATGMLQAQQAGNQLSGELAGQLMSLRQQLIMQSQSENADRIARQKEAADRTDITLTILGGLS